MWHEARRSERKVHDIMDAARKRAQRRAVYLAKRRGDPQQSLQVIGVRSRTYRDDGLYQATQDQQGLIPWNGKQNILIDRFDGRALLDFIRDSESRPFRVQEKTEEEEELEEFVNFERYRDLIKHRRRGLTDEEGLQHANVELEAKLTAPFAQERSNPSQAPANKGSYSQKAKEEEKRQKEVVKGDPAIRKLSRKERRKASQMEREREREAARTVGRVVHHDPYRSRSRSRSYSPSYLRRHDRGSHADNGHRSKSKPSKIEYITEFGGSVDFDEPKLQGVSPPQSPPHQADVKNWSGTRTFLLAKIDSAMFFSAAAYSGGHSDFLGQICGVQGWVRVRPSNRILEALHVDPASSISLEQEKSKLLKPSISTPSPASKLNKMSAAAAGPLKSQQDEKKETPQERLKRIMSKQLNKQIRKDTAAEMAKKREQERQRQEKLAETSRISRYRRHSSSRSRSRSRSPPRRHRRSRSPSRSRSPRRYHSRSRSPRVRSRSRY
ncbi:hypothetical protein QJS10_CPA09g00228 [Acorus calamus]|uniref:Suppressor of white apricot N-terminal domain-containing protein n=1 Tax=Acorus calamus TaxID=4465 RepID=A0AAV9E4A9_ACOCL|nr:hypothetical protein QJS10_CPA09g00228 [Acorus calamus]